MNLEQQIKDTMSETNSNEFKNRIDINKVIEQKYDSTEITEKELREIIFETRSPAKKVRFGLEQLRRKFKYQSNMRLHFENLLQQKKRKIAKRKMSRTIFGDGDHPEPETANIIAEDSDEVMESAVPKNHRKKFERMFSRKRSLVTQLMQEVQPKA